VLLLVRHGQTAANADGLLIGRTESALTERGRRQAAALGRLLGGVSVVVSSPLRRTLETAEMIEAPLEVDERWIEMDYGVYDGRPMAEVGAERWAAWHADPSYRLPGGESLEEVGRRVRSACADLAERAEEADVVVLSHVSPIKAAVSWALGTGDATAWRMHLAVASVSRVAVAGGRPVLHSFNETGHLA
jgi:broad specificity phosphatase PhoE